jgi:hypothetical protein
MMRSIALPRSRSPFQERLQTASRGSEGVLEEKTNHVGPRDLEPFGAKLLGAVLDLLDEIFWEAERELLRSGCAIHSRASIP